MINTDGYDLHKQKLLGILKFLRVLGEKKKSIRERDP